MALVETPEIVYGWLAEGFRLPGVDGDEYQLGDIRGEAGTLIMFICNHCPYVKAIAPKLPKLASDLKALNVGVAAIMSNDFDAYPADNFENMKAFAAQHEFNFPYLLDATQEVAKIYGAVCTPDFFGFDSDLAMQYRGRLDDSGMHHDPHARRELYEGFQKIVREGRGPDRQKPSIGCSIKWRDPNYDPLAVNYRPV